MNKSEYKEYLQTPHWISLKNKIYITYGQCYSCGAKRGLDVHHLTYENIGHEKLKDLRLLCRDCHYRTHRMNQGIRYWKPNDIIYAIWSWFKKAYTVDNRRERWRY